MLDDYERAQDLLRERDDDAHIIAGLVYRGLNTAQAEEITQGLRSGRTPNSVDKRAIPYCVFGDPDRPRAVSLLFDLLLLAPLYGLLFVAACATPEGKRKGLALLGIWIVCVTAFTALMACFGLVARRL